MVSLQGAAAALSFLGLLLQLLALVTPHWAGVGTHEFETSVGLWTLCMGRTCTRLPPGRATFELAKGLLTVSAILSFVAVSSILTSCCRLPRFKVGAVANTLTGLIGLSGLAMLGVTVSPLPNTFHPSVRPQLDWSFFAALTGSLAQLLSGLFCLITYLSSPQTPLTTDSTAGPDATPWPGSPS